MIDIVQKLYKRDDVDFKRHYKPVHCKGNPKFSTGTAKTELAGLLGSILSSDDSSGTLTSLCLSLKSIDIAQFRINGRCTTKSWLEDHSELTELLSSGKMHDYLCPMCGSKGNVYAAFGHHEEIHTVLSKYKSFELFVNWVGYLSNFSRVEKFWQY